jgi:DNA-binding transcriptional ArsR family regulator
VFSALSHPARRRILMTLNLEGGSMTAGELLDGGCARALL